MRFCPNNQGWRMFPKTWLLRNRFPSISIIFSCEPRTTFAYSDWWTVRSCRLNWKLSWKLVLYVRGHGWMDCTVRRIRYHTWYGTWNAAIILARELGEPSAFHLVGKVGWPSAASNTFIDPIPRRAQSTIFSAISVLFVALILEVSPLITSIAVVLLAILPVTFLPLASVILISVLIAPAARRF